MCQNHCVEGDPRLYIGVSTKAYLGYKQTGLWIAAARAALSVRPELAELGIRVFVAPSAPLILEAKAALAEFDCWVGAQDGQWQTGAATGAVSMQLLGEIGADFVELGHAERFSVFGETADETRRKAEAAGAAGLRVLLCIGEPARSSPEIAADHCLEQIRVVVQGGGIPLGRTLFAYEPWWAIGANRAAEPGYVNAVIATVKRRIHDEFAGQSLGVVYGGSAGPGTLGPLDHADGIFLGRFAHDPANFARVLDEAIARRRDR